MFYLGAKRVRVEKQGVDHHFISRRIRSNGGAKRIRVMQHHRDVFITSKSVASFELVSKKLCTCISYEKKSNKNTNTSKCFPYYS